jgi:hypothetical protein
VTNAGLWPNKWRKNILLRQFRIRQRFASAHPAHGLLKQIGIFPAIEPVAKLIQIAL